MGRASSLLVVALASTDAAGAGGPALLLTATTPGGAAPSVPTPTADLPPGWTFSWDPAAPTLSPGTVYIVAALGYDAAGNIISVSRGGVNDSGVVAESITNYTALGVTLGDLFAGTGALPGDIYWSVDGGLPLTVISDVVAVDGVRSSSLNP